MVGTSVYGLKLRTMREQPKNGQTFGLSREISALRLWDGGFVACVLMNCLSC